MIVWRIKNCYKAKDLRNLLHTIKRKANWIADILRRNCLLKHVIEGKIGVIEVTGRQGRRCKQLQNYFKVTRIYWKFKEKVPHLTLCRNRFERGCGPIVRDCGMNVQAVELRLKFFKFLKFLFDYTVALLFNMSNSTTLFVSVPVPLTLFYSRRRCE